MTICAMKSLNGITKYVFNISIIMSWREKKKKIQYGSSNSFKTFSSIAWKTFSNIAFYFVHRNETLYKSLYTYISDTKKKKKNSYKKL